MSRRIPPNQRRSARYVLLLTAEELEMAKTIAAREFRSLPDFFRRHIYESAAVMDLQMQRADRAPTTSVQTGDS